MGAAVKRTILSLFIFSVGVSLAAQQQYDHADSLAIDSIVNRIKTILNQYNETTVFIDTSDYEHFYSDAVDINLQIAASKGQCNEILRLVARGADVNNFIGKNGRPLHYAVAGGKNMAAEVLLLIGALPDLPDIYGNTSLIAAVKANDLEMAELLIRYGAAVSLGDKNGSTPLHHAAALGFFYLSDMLLYYESPVEIPDEEGNTPLMISVWAGYHDITDLLLGAGANPNAADNKGFTPLMMAAQNGDTLMLRMLIDKGANLYPVNNDGLDALSTATRNGRKDAVVFLLKNGNRWEHRASALMNPINIARIYGQSELVPLLTHNGIEAAKEFALDEVVFSAGGLITNHHSLISGNISLREPRIKAGITAGADFNPVSTRLLVKEGDNSFYQYKVRTSVIHAGFFKEFILHRSLNDARWSAVTSLSAGYHIYSFYEGTRQKPGKSFCLIPAVCVEWNQKHFGMKAGASYMKTPFYKVSPLWFSLGSSFNLYKKIPRAPGKKVRLYSYE
ncbi:MAG TPA: ankyrin repeat domain-containing protein [Bacteroidales bacterium]|nr:ankyrin repeat domain-containing protein [Bacteroidales bacterium]